MSKTIRSKSAKRQKAQEQKRAEKAMRFRRSADGDSNSVYALKHKAQRRGQFSPRSPFRSVEIT